MVAPKPHDPRLPHTTPEEVRAKLNEIYEQAPDTLVDEVVQLEAAHEVLSRALHND